MSATPSPRTVDAALALGAIALGVVALAFDLGDGEGSVSALSFVLIVVGGAALLVRRGFPVVVLGVAALVHVGVVWDSGDEPAALAIAAVALYTVARGTDRLRGVAIASAVAVVVAVTIAVLGDDPVLAELPGESALLFLPIVVADAARSRSDRVQAMIDAEARSRVQAERLRIARDLHDVVAHGLSTMTVRAGIAGHLLDRDPSQAREALEDINATGKHALEELRAMVGVLRTTDQTEDAPLLPAPTDPDDLSAIVDGSGLPVDAEVAGRFPSDVSDGCVVALHRILHEALTNVARHAGPVATSISIRHGDDGVEVTVVNAAGTGAGGPSASTGVGVAGMVERAEAIGGRLVAGPRDDGGYEVRAELPYRRRST